MKKFQYADIHCHPNLKTFGHSFDKNANSRSDMWHTIPPSFFSKQVHRFTGITKFTQTDFSTMSRAKCKIAFVSLYPFEKGFFINKNVTPPLAAFLADWGIEIGYERVRFLQQHTDYFDDLLNEYNFILKSNRQGIVDGTTICWQFTNNWKEVEELLPRDNSIAVILTIEGAHVFNTGLDDFGVAPVKSNILSNIQTLKSWEHVPLFIGLAHNFNNDMCGHARSLQRLGKLVNQEKNLDTGLSELGKDVLHALLDESNGRRIYIDLKHMSLISRQEYYEFLRINYPGIKIPLVVSHGSVTGLSIRGEKRQTNCLDIFNTSDLNFFDEEIIQIALSGGLFGVQMDIGNNVDISKGRKYNSPRKNEKPIKSSARIIWNQLQYIAELLDSKGLFAWGCVSIGSDFDGSINPFPGILTAAGFEPMAYELEKLANEFLAANLLDLPENKEISAEEIIERFLSLNVIDFLKEYYH